MASKLISELRRVWDEHDKRSDWIKTFWLVQKQLDEVEEKNYVAISCLKESADILIILIKWLDNLGIDFEKLCLWRLKTRMEGKTEEICKKYRKMYNKEVVQK